MSSPGTGYRLYTLAGLFAALLFPTQIPADPGKSQICGGDKGFMHRRLNSDQQENLCEVYFAKPQSKTLTMALEKLL